MTFALARDWRGSAAAEMALVLPLLLALTFGSLELGNYFLSEHVLLKGVRDGAVYAARQNLPLNYDCSAGTLTVPTTVVDNTKSLVRSGELSGGTDRLPLWADVSTTFTVSATCVTSAGGTTLAGMYLVNGGKVPVVTVAADLPYQSLMGTLGLGQPGLRLEAQQQAIVTGI
jgi:Flp pilus assembly protein TadG